MSAAAVLNALTSDIGASAGDLDKPAVNLEASSPNNALKSNDRILSVQDRYIQERNKRLRSDGTAQFIDITYGEKYKHLADDIWAADGTTHPRLTLQDGVHTKVMVVGGGFGGLTFAARLIQAGIRPDDIVVVESGGGFGGTWYWNRYPGLMCDVESYIYMPLLAETEYMPKHKYSYGPELRAYSNTIAEHFGFRDRGAFQQQVKSLDWDDAGRYWRIKVCDLVTNSIVEVTADFVQISPGLLHRPKLVNMLGVDEFKGHSFHTSRWDYDFTGGSPEDPSLTKLKDKRVGVIGTGATAIQAVPHLAKWAKELFVFQRTPSSVDTRGQRPTDPKWFADMTRGDPDWQSNRNKNFNAFIHNAEPLPRVNLVNDGWSTSPSYSALVGSPKTITMDDIGDYVAKLHALDMPRTERIRARIDTIVHDHAKAQSLKAWYPTWCKRPCFHDDYLPTFNQANVTLVDTDGKGVEQITETGVVANGQQYDLDCIVFGTGFNLEGSKSPGQRAGIKVFGRKGMSLDIKWAEDLATLHGLLTHDFPNLFFSGPSQATASANFTSTLDTLAQHSTYIITEALKKADPGQKVVIEPSKEAEEAWTRQIMSGAMIFAATSGCTPSYLNGEGAADNMSDEQKMKAAKGAMWSRGFNDFVELLQAWREKGDLPGLEIHCS